MKTCTICRQAKPLESFNRNRRMRDGRLNQCIPCRRQGRRYDTPKAIENAQRSALKELGLKHCTRCGEIKTLDNFYVRKAGGIYPICKPCNSISCKPQVMARRARLRNAFVEFVDPQVVFERHGGACGICKLPIADEFHVDHIVPLSKGGEHSYANTQPAHPLCNRQKGARMFTTQTASIG